MSKLVETTIINLHIQILENLVNSTHWVVIMKQSHTGFHRFFLSMTILWFDKGALHVLYFWVVGSWVTWFFSSWKRRTASKAEQIHKKTTIVTQNNILEPFWVKKVVISSAPGFQTWDWLNISIPVLTYFSAIADC